MTSGVNTPFTTMKPFFADTTRSLTNRHFTSTLHCFSFDLLLISISSVSTSPHHPTYSVTPATRSRSPATFFCHPFWCCHCDGQGSSLLLELHQKLLKERDSKKVSRLKKEGLERVRVCQRGRGKGGRIG
jgi:hypothetical protein